MGPGWPLRAFDILDDPDLAQIIALGKQRNWPIVGKFLGGAMGALYESLHGLEEFQKGQIRRPPRSEATKLHDRLIWSAWVDIYEDEVGHRSAYVEDGTSVPFALRSDEWSAYRNAARSVGPTKMKQLSTLYPTIGEVAEWPIWLLDRDAKRRGHDAIERHCTKDGSIDSDYERGDIAGFFSIAARFHIGYLDGDAQAQWDSALRLVGALPALCRHPAVLFCRKTVFKLVKDLFILLPDCAIPIFPDWAMIERQSDDPSHEPSYVRRKELRAAGIATADPDYPVISFKLVRCKSTSAHMPFAGLAVLNQQR
jgi:hypothetical protein